MHSALRSWRACFNCFGMRAQICALSVGVVALDARKLGHSLCCFVAIVNWVSLSLCLMLSWVWILLLILLLRSVFFVFGLLNFTLTRVLVMVLLFNDCLRGRCCMLLRIEQFSIRCPSCVLSGAWCKLCLLLLELKLLLKFGL